MSLNWPFQLKNVFAKEIYGMHTSQSGSYISLNTVTLKTDPCLVLAGQTVLNRHSVMTF